MSVRYLDDERAAREHWRAGTGGWCSALVRCRQCGHEHVAVWPGAGDRDDLECDACHAMACVAVPT